MARAHGSSELPKLSENDLDRIVQAVLERMQRDVPQGDPFTSGCGGDEGHHCTAAPRPPHGIDRPVYPDVLPKLLASTPSLIAVGRAGARFRTDLYLRLREGHADARDAVHSELPAAWAKEHDCLALQTRCVERGEYLLHPNLGRRLDDPSRGALESLAGTHPDVQIVVGDGLSPNAIAVNGAATLEALTAALGSAGMRCGRPVFVRFARIGVADEIGVVTGARATVMLVGERPGLGSGDSLSLYLAINPRLDPDNAETNCISNVRPLGTHPREAAGLAAQILQRGFAAGVGGVALGLGWGRQ
jgi:ethanolamine ammonia-lyase small subunit